MTTLRTIRIALGLLAVSLVLGSGSASAENWPQWRGANLDGISHEKNLPLKWSKTENVAWRLALPGPAGATPVVWDDRIFLTSAEGDSLVLMAVSTDGKPLWKQVMADHNKTVRVDEGNSASPSPATDGRHVWAMMGTGDIGCYTVDGKPVWKFNLQDRYGKFKIQFGMTSTPVLDGDRLYVQLLHSGGALVVALDKLTGEEIWQQTRPSDARAECEHSYASPVLYRDDKTELLLTHGCDYIVAHRLSDGEEVWRCGGLNIKSNYNPTLRFVASPLAVPGLVIVPSAKNGPVLALDPHSKGDITDYRSRPLLDPRSQHAGRPLAAGGRRPVVPVPRGRHADVPGRQDRRRVLHQADPRRPPPGVPRLRRRQNLPDRPRRHGHGGQARQGLRDALASNDMEESTSSSPAISNGRIYIRTFDALYAVGAK